MNPAARRVLLYWLLLLLPTLAVGGGVLWLLHREQARLDEHTRAAIETRRAAVGSRARLIAENVELMVGDAQTGLMATLLEAPADEGLDAFLADWRKTNPLVRETFRLDASGRADKPWLARLPAEAAPWNATAVAQADVTPQQRVAVSQQQGYNNFIVQNSRNELNVISKMKGGYTPPAGRSGWFPWREGARLHVIGWRELPGAGVVGIDLELSQIAARLGDVLPEDREPGESYELREIGGATYSQLSMRSFDYESASAPAAVITVPIAETVLPGWEVVGFLATNGAERLSGGTFFALSALLASGLVAAILAGGTLLLRQARLSEEEAAQKTSFVANVSHEFKTPLTTIRLYAELLEQRRVADPAKQADYLRTISRETQRLARLVGNALDFSRLEQGRKKFDRVPLDAAAELRALLDTHAPRLAEAGLRMEADLPDAPCPLVADRDALQQIVLNLLDNACKYAAEGGEARVALAPAENGGAVIRVSDRGPGVPPAQRERIFEKFHRLDDRLTAAHAGAGLGLSIARRLARGLGGDLRCAERAGGGAEFILTLP